LRFRKTSKVFCGGVFVPIGDQAMRDLEVAFSPA
jgi:hypothetical protein